MAKTTPQHPETFTEKALTQSLSGDLSDAWLALRRTAAALGPQRIYASRKAIMFSRSVCHFFVRPKKTFLEICFFVHRTVEDPRIRRVYPSNTRSAHHPHSPQQRG